MKKRRIMTVSLMMICLFILCGCNEKPYEVSNKWYATQIIAGEQVYSEGEMYKGKILDKTSYVFEILEDGDVYMRYDDLELHGLIRKRFQIFKLKSYWEIVISDGKQYTGRCEKDDTGEYKFIIEGRYYTYVLVPQKN